MFHADTLKKHLLGWLPLVAVTLLASGLGCNRMGQQAVKGVPKAATLLLQDGKVIIFELGAVELDALIVRYAPHELEVLLPRLALSVEEVSVTQLGSRNLGLYSKVFVRGPVDDLFAAQLNKSGVPYFQSLDVSNPLLHRPQEMEFLFLGSKDPTTFRSMYGNQDISAIGRATGGKDKIGSIVENSSELKDRLTAASKQNRMVTLIFHEKDGIIPFADGGIALSDVGRQLDLSRLMVLSCNTYQTSGLSLRSSGLVNLESLCKGLRMTQLQHQGKVLPAEFYSSFATHFKEVDQTQRLLWNLKAVGGATAGVGTASGAFIGGFKLANIQQGSAQVLPVSPLPTELPTKVR